MMLRKVYFLCLSAVLIQTITCQCVRNGYNCVYLDNGLSADFVAGLTNGGRFTVTCYSKIPSSGLAVHSDNLAVSGPLTVCGQLPFLGIVALSGALPADGIGTVQYDCGNGRVGITEEVEENAMLLLTNAVAKNLGSYGVSCNDLGLTNYYWY